jgi:hypothetical protein
MKRYVSRRKLKAVCLNNSQRLLLFLFSIGVIDLLQRNNKLPIRQMTFSQLTNNCTHELDFFLP